MVGRSGDEADAANNTTRLYYCSSSPPSAHLISFGVTRECLVGVAHGVLRSLTNVLVFLTSLVV